jgi:hypothetical protein
MVRNADVDCNGEIGMAFDALLMYSVRRWFLATAVLEG